MNLELLRQYCLSLPGCVEDVKYGSDLCFSIGGKIFLGTRLNGPFRTGIKCTQELFAELTEREGIVPMPRLANTGWVRIEKADALNKNEWEDYINQSYNIVVASLPKKKREGMGLYGCTLNECTTKTQHYAPFMAVFTNKNG